jgi:glycosyltransferase involved in cell wall biosynthesis
MRIALNGRFYGARTTGVQRFAREIATRLSTCVDTVVLVPRSVNPDRRPDAQGAVRGVLDGSLWELVEFPWRARSLGCTVGLHLANSAPPRGGPHVLVVHDVTPLTHPEWYTGRFVWWWRAVVAPAVRRAERVLTVSHWTREEIARTLGMPVEMIGVVGQGTAPFDRPAKPDLVAQVLERHRLAPGYALALGGTTPRKNLRFLVEVFEVWTRAGGEPPQLVVVGEESPRVHRAVRTRALRDGDMAVRRLGHVSDGELHALYTAAAVFCFPSLAEGFGRPPLEAMACGTPVIAAAYGAAPEVLGDAAMILPLEPESWIDGLEHLLGEGDERNEWIGRGLRRVAGVRWEVGVKTVVAACEAATAGQSGACRG